MEGDSVALLADSHRLFSFLPFTTLCDVLISLSFDNGARGNVGRKHARLHERIHAGGGPFARLHVCITYF